MTAKPRDLEERTESFALAVREFVRALPRTVGNLEDVKQLGCASGSVAANCIEANEALGAKDRVMRFRIARKEAKECQRWLKLVHTAGNPALDDSRAALAQESMELKLILTAIIKKLE